MSTQDVVDSIPGTGGGGAPPTPGPGSDPVVRTILRMRVREGSEQAFEAAWRTAAAEIARVPGQLGQELMRDEGDRRWFAIVSDWADRASVDAFGRSAARETLTEALRDLREDATRETFSVLATVAPEQSPVVRVEITTGVEPGEEEAFEHAWLAVAHDVGAEEGNLLEQLLREPDGLHYRITSEWESEDHLVRWVSNPVHVEHGRPLGRWYARQFEKHVYHLRQSAVRDTSFTPVAADDEGAPPVRSVVTTAVEPGEQEAFERAWASAAHDAAHEEGSLLQELLREDDGQHYRLVSEWRSQADLTRSTGDLERSALLGPLRHWLPADPAPSLLHLRQSSVRDASFRSIPAGPASTAPADDPTTTPPPHPRAEQGTDDTRGTSA